MRLEQLTVQLRARSSWEAMELGMALVRRHAAAIWKPWLLVTLPVFALLNAAGWALDLIGLAGVLMWWFKPVFDRIPLYVASRAVFGAVPGVRETVRAQADWGWRPMLHYLTWRRFSPVRSLYLPVDLLEGVQGQRLRERRRVLAGAIYGNAALLTLVCLHFEGALFLGGIAGILMFTPLDLLPETLRTTWTLIAEQSPAWVKIGLNAMAWMAVSVIEPFFVGAGFGLYLNRRTQLEAWDVEIVFRKLRGRLARGASALLVMIAILGAAVSAPAQAQDASEAPAPHESVDADETPAAPTLPEVFGKQRVDERNFHRASEQAYRDPSLNRTVVQKRWERIDKAEAEPERATPRPEWLQGVLAMFAFLAEWGLWILAGVLLLALLLTARYWLPWMRGQGGGRAVAFDAGTTHEPARVPEALPDDVASAARRLWREGRARDALALVYRAGVQAMGRRAQVELPPGATEAECLRLSRRMAQSEDRQLFARIVRVWQYAAYAQRLPEEAEFESLLGQMQARGGWLA
ncbi:DUF4129 domain-containing protein [Pseudoxanthomonas beigongshangi]